MSATVIDTLKIVAGLDARGVEQGMQKMQGTLEGGLRSIMTSFVGPLMGALSAGKLFADYTSKADAIGKMSAALNVDGEALQAWGEAAARAGGSVDGFNNSVGSLNRRIQEFLSKGSGEAKETLAALGLSPSALTDAQGNAKDVFEIMQTLAEKAEKMDNAKFAGIAEKLGIDKGTVMLLQSGRRAVDDLVARQKSLGVYTKRDFVVTAAFNDAVADMGQVFKAVAATVMRVVTPALTKITEWLTEGLMWLRRHEPLVLAFIGLLAAAITAKLVPAVASFIQTGVKFMASPWGAAITLITGIALAIDDLYAYMQGGESMFADFWSLFGTGEEISARLAAAWEWLKEKGTQLMHILKEWGPAIAKGFAAFYAARQAYTLVTTLISAFQAFKGVASILGLVTKAQTTLNAAISANPVGAIIALIVGAAVLIITNWDTVKEYFTAFWAWFQVVAGPVIDWLSEAWNSAVETIKGVWGGLTEAWDGICGSISEAWDDTIGWMIGKFAGFIDGVKGAWGTVKGWFGFGDDEEAAPTPTHTAQSGRMHGGASGSFEARSLPTGNSAMQAVKPSQISQRTNIDNDTTVNANITVQTQATDAQGIAQGIGAAMENDFRSRDLVNIGNGGVIK